MTSTCHPNVCPHMHFNKCLKQRIRCIPVSIFPDPTIDSFTNVNVKCGKQYKSNIPTLAYEKFNHFHEESNDQRNYIKDFYMQNYEQEKMVLNNNIVQELGEEMYQNSAYILAEKATVDYEKFQQKRKQSLNRARNRAQSAYHSHRLEKKTQLETNQEQNGYWLKKLFRKLQQIAKHIISGEGEDEQEKQKQYLQSKSALTATFLSQIKIRNPKNAYQILSQLRTLMQKKKLLFSDARQEQQLNKSATMSFVSEASQNVSQGSMISSATSLNQSKVFGQEQLVEKLWNFQHLRNKWNLRDLQQVKDMLRRMLTRKVVYEAQVGAVKKRRQNSRINRQIISKSEKSTVKKQREFSTKKIQSFVRRKAQSVKQNRPQKSQVKYLTNQEQAIKNKLIQGGRFDATGQKFERNRRYSQLFNMKQDQISPTFILTRQSKNTLVTKNSLLTCTSPQTIQRSNKK